LTIFVVFGRLLIVSADVIREAAGLLWHRLLGAHLSLAFLSRPVQSIKQQPEVTILFASPPLQFEENGEI